GLDRQVKLAVAYHFARGHLALSRRRRRFGGGLVTPHHRGREWCGRRGPLRGASGDHQHAEDLMTHDLSIRSTQIPSSDCAKILGRGVCPSCFLPADPVASPSAARDRVHALVATAYGLSLAQVTANPDACGVPGQASCASHFNHSLYKGDG